jgi:hypothetical protein
MYIYGWMWSHELVCHFLEQASVTDVESADYGDPDVASLHRLIDRG